MVATWTGLQTRALRTALRMTLLGFAEHLGVGARTVSDWEAGGSGITPKPGMQEVLDVALERASGEVKARFVKLVSDHVKPVPDSSAGEKNGDGTNRREAVEGILAMGAATVLSSPGWRLVEALDVRADVPAHVGMADVVRIRDAVHDLEKLDQQVGGGPTRYLAVGELRRAVSLTHSSMTPQVRQELTAATALLADLAAWTTFDAGLDQPARELFVLGLGAARESGDHSLLTNVADGFARLELYARDTKSAFDLICLGQSLSSQLPTSARARLEILAAQAFAQVSDLQACRNHIHLGEDHYARAELAKDPDWMQYFTPATLEKDIATAQYDLALQSGQRDEAVFERLWTAADRYPASRARSKAISAARLANLLYRDGQVADGAIVAAQALDLAASVRSVRLADDLRAMANSAKPYTHDESTATVCTRTNRLLRTMSGIDKGPNTGSSRPGR